MNATIKTPTHSEAVKAFDSVLSSFMDKSPLNENEIHSAVAGFNAGIQIRDYVMGRTILDMTAEDSASFFRFLIATAGESVGLYTLLALSEYRAGEKELTQKALNKAAELDSSYSLAMLLVRCFNAGYPVESFESMAKELHSKVVEGIESLADVIAGEESN